jgi:hypothetical protein
MTQSHSLPTSPQATVARGHHQTDRKAGHERTDVAAQVEGPLLPATARLLALLRTADAVDGLPVTADEASRRLASYCARPEENGPFLRFHVAEANSTLLGVVQRSTPGFEVLQIHGGTFRYHWRNDLVRAFEEEVPILGRYWAFSGDRVMAVEHLAVPVIVRHRVREMRGWFVFGQDLVDDTGSSLSLSIVRRPLRSSIVKLPDRPLQTTEVSPASRRDSGSVRAQWGRAGRSGHRGTRPDGTGEPQLSGEMNCSWPDCVPNRRRERP